MTRRSKTSKKSTRAPFRVPVLNTMVTLNRSTKQGYVLLPDPERGGVNVRHYVGRLLRLGVDPDTATLDDVEPSALQEAARLVSEHRAGVGRGKSIQVTIDQLLDRFLASKPRASKAEKAHFAGAFAPVRDLYGSSPASEFGPLKLQAVRKRMVDSGSLNRRTVNDRVFRIRAAFAWGVAQELVPASVPQALACVKSIRFGDEPELRERRKVSGVPDEHVDAVLPFVSEQVKAIVELMRLSGARCDEVVKLRPCDLNQTREPWIFQLTKHKTAHRGKSRSIAFGPRARAILRPWLLRPSDRFCFSPQEAEQERQERRHAARTTPEDYGNGPGTNRVREPQKAPGEIYTTASVRRAIERACVRAKVPKWTPHQLRHSAATKVKSEAGHEAARLVLGHSTVDVTELYCDRDEGLVRDVMERIG